MKIRFIKKRLKHYLLFGTLWIALGITAVLYDSGNPFNYGYLLIGALYVGTFIFENSYQYLTIENGTITKSNLLPQKISLDEIKRIKKLAGNYVLITESTELRINTELIEKKSLLELDRLLESLNLEAK